MRGIDEGLRTTFVLQEQAQNKSGDGLKSLFHSGEREGLGEYRRGRMPLRRRLGMAAGGDEEGNAPVGKCIRHRPAGFALQMDIENRGVEAPGLGLRERTGDAVFRTGHRVSQTIQEIL